MFVCKFLNNNCCPESTSDKIIIKATGFNFYNGLSDEYETRFPEQLEGLVHKNAYAKVITEVNHIVEDYWPCGPSQLIGACFCPLTLGLSLLCPYICIKDCEKMLRERIAQHNKNYFEHAGYKMVLRKRCLMTSWLEITKIDHNKLDLDHENDNSIKKSELVSTVSTNLEE